MAVTPLSVRCETVDAINPLTDFRCYPYPYLRKSGQNTLVDVRLIRIENEFISVEIAPEFGARIWSWTNKLTGSSLISGPEILQLTDGGPRGCCVEHGVQICVDQSPRLNSLGPVEVELVEPSEENGGIAAILLNELVLGRRLSWSGAYVLRPEAAALDLQIRTLNRGLGNEVIHPGLRVGGAGAIQFCGESGAILSLSNQLSLAVTYAPGEFDEVGLWEGSARVARYSKGFNLAPRRTESWSVTLAETPTQQNFRGVSSFGSLAHARDISISVFEPVADAIIVLKTDEGQVEAHTQLAPGQVWFGDSTSLPGKVEQVAVLSNDRQILLQSELGSLARSDDSPNSVWSIDDSSNEVLLNRLARQFESRHAVSLARAHKLIAAQDFDGAQAKLEQSLAYNGEDPLTWWLSGAVARHQGNDEAPGTENAHFLSPLEPVLRAEAFLAQAQTHGHEPSAIVKPIANDPNALLEVTHLLLESGFTQDAIRWIDECLRHRDLPLLRWMLAWQYLVNSRMEAEAAAQAQAGDKLPLEPPFPWRKLEREAVRVLSERFPNLKNLATASRAASESTSR